MTINIKSPKSKSEGPSSPSDSNGTPGFGHRRSSSGPSGIVTADESTSVEVEQQDSKPVTWTSVLDKTPKKPWASSDTLPLLMSGSQLPKIVKFDSSSPPPPPSSEPSAEGSEGST